MRQNVHYGAKVIKVCVDCEGYPYTVDQMRFFVSEAANAGLKVACHVQTEKGARNAIEAGVWSIEHGRALTDELLQMMKAKGMWRVGTDWADHAVSRQQGGLRPDGRSAEVGVPNRRQERLLDRLRLLRARG